MRTRCLFPWSVVAAVALGAAALPWLAARTEAQDAPAAKARGSGAKSNDPGSDDRPRQQIGATEITSETFDYDLQEKRIIFVGDVELISPNTRMTAARMVVQLTKQQEIDWLRSEGNVFVERKGEDGTLMTGRGATLEHFDLKKKTFLRGGVTIHQSSERLAKPAVITGEWVEMDGNTRVNVVHRSEKEQAKAHVEPKGSKDEPEPEPVDLFGDEITMNDRTQEYIATGKPSMVKPSSTLYGRVIRFAVDEKTNDIEKAFAENDVVFDAQNESGSITHATGDHAVYTKATSEIVLTGEVVDAFTKDPDDEQPNVHRGKKFVYNSKTRKMNLFGDGKTKALVVIPQKRQGAKKNEGPAAAPPAAPEKPVPAPATGGAKEPGKEGGAGGDQP